MQKSVFRKKVETQSFWTFELRDKEGIDVPIRNIIGFQQKERQDSQNNVTFYRPPVTSAQFITGTEKNPD